MKNDLFAKHRVRSATLVTTTKYWIIPKIWSLIQNVLSGPISDFCWNNWDLVFVGNWFNRVLHEYCTWNHYCFFYALMLNNFGLLRDCFLIKTGVQGFLRERSQFLFYFLATNAHEAHAKRVQESIIVHCDKIVLTVKVFSTQTKHVYIAMFWHNARNTVWHRNFAPCCRLANTQIVQKNASMLLENWDQHVMGFICFSPKFMAGHGGIMVYHEFMVFLVGFYRLFIFWFVWEFVGNMLTPGTTSYMIQTR